MEREFNNCQLYVKEDIFHTESSCFKPNSTGVRGHVSVLVIQMADIMYCNLHKKDSVTLGTEGFFPLYKWQISCIVTFTKKIVLPWVPKVFFRARG